MADLKACNLVADSLFSQIITHHKLQDQDQKIIDANEIQIDNLKNQVKEKITIAELSDKQLKRAKRQIIMYKIGLSVAGAVAILEAGMIIIK